MEANVYYVGRFDKDGKLLYLDSGPYIEERYATEAIENHVWTSSHYKVLTQKIQLEIYGR